MVSKVLQVMPSETRDDSSSVLGKRQRCENATEQVQLTKARLDGLPECTLPQVALSLAFLIMLLLCGNV